MGRQSGTSQRLAHHQIRSIGLDADGVAVGLGIFPTSSAGQLVRRHRCLPSMDEAGQSRNKPVDLQQQQTISVWDVQCCDGGFVFVCFLAHPFFRWG